MRRCCSPDSPTPSVSVEQPWLGGKEDPTMKCIQRQLADGGDVDVPLPLYHRVYAVLRQQIEEGRWQPDPTMPSEHQLASTFSVSRITIRRALQRLEKEK